MEATTTTIGTQGLNGHLRELAGADGNGRSQTSNHINGDGLRPLLPYHEGLPRVAEQSYPSDRDPKIHLKGPPSLLPSSSIHLHHTPNGKMSSDSSSSRDTRSSVNEVDAISHITSHASQDGTPDESATTTSMASLSVLKQSMLPSALPNNFSSPDLRASSNATDFVPGSPKYRPKSSIPSRLPTGVYAQQCVAAAYASRLDPYALHRKEQEALQDHLCHLHVTVYLNIRNGILRLWTRNPMVSVTKEEAMGCAKDYRWMNLAAFAYEWLVRHGYINFGCVEIPVSLATPRKGRRKEGPVIVVVGAGMAGLGCARQLEGLFHQYQDSFTSPRVVLVEGRRRIGGRIYSHPLRSLQPSGMPPGMVPKAEMGAHIIVGFDHGNPLDAIIRGQLALPYHLLRDISTIYDIDGSPVDEVRDAMDERLYNDVLDRSGFYRHKSVVVSTAEGDRDFIDSGRDVVASDGLTVRQYEEARAAGTIGLLLPAKRVRRGVGHKTADIKAPGAPVADLGPTEEQPAALACQAMGWNLNDGISPNDSLNLDPVVRASKYPTLGAVMDEGVKQYRRMLPLTPKDMRLLNWHFANLEYANAVNIGKLSLSGWDQDMGNEFEGEHSQVVGGYQQLPYGLWSLPSKLDVRTNKIVTKISYDPSETANQRAAVHCEDGEIFEADRVVFTGSLGVLKTQSIQFSPPLPDWKRAAINRLGFGVLNKVILVFDQPFWDIERDMFGLLREPNNRDSMVQEDYSANRGRFYLFWNCMKTTGLPVLIALMAGDAALQAECTPDGELVAEVTSQLRNVFKHTAVPDPLETIVTRWGTDRFTRGSYSYVAAHALPGDYDLMATRLGNLHFAGEATCGTHPATVHGAYLSGLRAASEVMDSVLGPIEVPSPLVPEKGKSFESNTSTPAATGQKRKEPPSSSDIGDSTAAPLSPEDVRRRAYDQAMLAAVHAEIGPPMPRPARTGLNPFLLYQKDYWGKCRAQCDEARRAATGDPNARAARDEIRAALGLMWRQAAAEEKLPYLEQSEVNRQRNAEICDRWRRTLAEWEKKSRKLKERWCKEHPFKLWMPEGELADNKSKSSGASTGVANGVAPHPPPATAAAAALTAPSFSSSSDENGSTSHPVSSTPSSVSQFANATPTAANQGAHTNGIPSTSSQQPNPTSTPILPSDFNDDQSLNTE